jgi:hypothetical protein
MRDVTPQPSPEIDIKELIDYLIDYVKNPVKKIASLPNWSWSTLFVLHIVLSVASGVLAGLIKFNFLRVAAGLFLMPVVSTIAALLMSMFLYYYFQFFEDRSENFRRLFTLVVLASIPFYLFQILSEYVSFISVIGFAFTSLLAVVALVENFALERKRAQVVSASLFALVFLTWLTNQFV